MSFGRVAELAADAVSLRVGAQERFDFHAAVNGGELFARRDAGRDELVGHRVCDADDRVAAGGGEDFAAAEERAGGRVLVRMEWRAVDGVNDGGTLRRQAAARPKRPALPLWVWTTSGRNVSIARPIAR